MKFLLIKNISDKLRPTLSSDKNKVLLDDDVEKLKALFQHKPWVDHFVGISLSKNVNRVAYEENGILFGGNIEVIRKDAVDGVLHRVQGFHLPSELIRSLLVGESYDSTSLIKAATLIASEPVRTRNNRACWRLNDRLEEKGDEIRVRRLTLIHATEDEVKRKFLECNYLVDKVKFTPLQSLPQRKFCKFSIFKTTAPDSSAILAKNDEFLKYPLALMQNSSRKSN